MGVCNLIKRRLDFQIKKITLTRLSRNWLMFLIWARFSSITCIR